MQPQDGPFRRNSARVSRRVQVQAGRKVGQRHGLKMGSSGKTTSCLHTPTSNCVLSTENVLLLLLGLSPEQPTPDPDLALTLS